MKKYDLFLAIGRSGSVLQRRNGKETANPRLKGGKQNTGEIRSVANDGESRKPIPHAAAVRSGYTPPRSGSIKKDIDNIGYHSGGDHTDRDGRID